MSGNSAEKDNDQLNTTSPSDAALAAQYKEFIREQDVHIQRLTKIVESLTKEKHDYEVYDTRIYIIF